jgi:MSHA biogenesis protein MshQ
VTSNGAVEGITQVRSGRLWLGNAFGSEFLTLRMPMQTLYWTATGWQKNTADSCTQLTVPTSGNGGLVFGTQTTVNQLTVGETTATMAGTPAGRVVNGDPLLSLSAPGAGNFGYVDVAAGNLGAPTWLPPTGSARACFGTCGPRRPVVIFQRGGY